MGIEEIERKIYRMEVEIPIPSLKYINSYLIKGISKNAIIDTGWDNEKSFSSFLENLGSLGFMIKDINYVIITHFHVDHAGLVSKIRKINNEAKFYMSKADKSFILNLVSNRDNFLSSMMNMIKSIGAPKEMHSNIGIPWAKRINMYEEMLSYIEELSEGDVLSTGERELEVIWTPGHTPGHICLYDHETKLLFTGDHILPRISSNIFQLIEDANYLLDYLRSLNKILNVDAKKALPAHEYVFTDLKKRVEELKLHHLERLMEIIENISPEGSTPYEIASKIKWRLGGKKWEETDIFQKSMALGETLAHLVFLEKLGMVDKKIDSENKLIKYFKTNKANKNVLKEEYDKLVKS